MSVVHASPNVQLQSPTIECISRPKLIRETTAPSLTCYAPTPLVACPCWPACSTVCLTRSPNTPHGRWMASSSLAWRREGGGDTDVGGGCDVDLDGRCRGVKEAVAPTVRTPTTEVVRHGDIKEAAMRTSMAGVVEQRRWQV
jgi:hypothetical protein